MAGIIVKSNPTSGSTPDPQFLAVGELAFNSYDGRLFSKKQNGELVLINYKPSATASLANTATSASHAVTASFALTGGSGGSVISSSWASSSISSSYSLSALSASYAPGSPSISASYALTASYISTDAMVFSENAVPVIPTTASYTYIRTGSLGGAVRNISNGIRLETTSSTTNVNQLIYALSTITTGSNGWQATGRFRSHAPQANWAMAGIVVKGINVSGSGVSMGRGSDSVVGFNRNTWTNDTTWASVAAGVIWHDPNFWLRVVESPVSRSWFVSTDGDFWQRFYAEARLGNAVVTGSYVGPFINPNYGATTNLQNVPTAIDCLSWKVEPL